MFCKFNVSERPCFIQIQWRIEEDTGSQPLDPKHPDMQMHPHACEHTSTDTYTYIIHMKKIKKRCGRGIGSLVSLIFTLQYNFFLSDLLSCRDNFFLQAVCLLVFFSIISSWPSEVLLSTFLAFYSAHAFRLSYNEFLGHISWYNHLTESKNSY